MSASGQFEYANLDLEAPLKQILVPALILGSIAWPALADRRDHEFAREAVRSGQALPLNEILTRIRPQLGGEIVGVELEREDGRYVYEFRFIAADGSLRKIHVDASTANILDRGDR